MQLFNKGLKKKKPGYWNNYQTWEEALLDSDGYDFDIIIKKVTNSSLKVKNGVAAFERDSVIFDSIYHSWPVVSFLLQNIINYNNELRIIDFGGSLGSTYFACKTFFPKNINIKWGIVEQEKFVNIGKEYFQTDELSFYYSLEEAQERIVPNVLFLGSSLPYIKEPYELLERIFQFSISDIIIDRTAVLLGYDDRITLQVVPPEIYDASYPAWFFNENKLLSSFNNASYQLIADFDAIGKTITLEDCTAQSKGFLFKKK